MFAWPQAASATYSIAATDTDTAQVGGAAISCLGGNFSVGIVYGSAVGAGVVHAQAYVDFDFRGRQRAVELLEEGIAPAEIIAEITDPLFDSDAERRQYGVVDVSGRAAGFTGSEASSHASDRQGALGSFAYSVQGNLLTSEAVIEQAEEAFRAGGCDLADRLVRALEAGADGGEGDHRCTGDGIPGDTAFLQVDRPGEPAWLRIELESEAGLDALAVLRAEYDAWRADNPCPASGADAGISADAGGIADAGSAGGDAGGADAGHDAGDRGGGCATASPNRPFDALALVILSWLAIRLAARGYRSHESGRTLSSKASRTLPGGA